MVKKVELYEASDGKSFKTKKGAENHEKKLAVKNATESLNLSESEISKILSERAGDNKRVEMLLKVAPDWTKWPVHLINAVNEGLLDEPEKKTIYIFREKSWHGNKDTVLAEESGDQFTDDDRFCGDQYKVSSVEQENDYKRKVFYDYASSWEERMAEKLKSGVKLEEHEIAELASMDSVYEEEGDEGRWDRQMTTVVKLFDDCYAIDWSRGLTESQENSFYEQPYLVEVEVKDVIVKKTFINKI